MNFITENVAFEAQKEVGISTELAYQIILEFSDVW